ncbi:MAG: hypothetical protein JW928_04650 [Candidatus Aureabacteria bacterium]|nr:hypothetical protein [Candidatus Auribacterota bacterium]
MMIYEDIFRAFKKERIKYVIVGGIAVNLLGFVRSTADLDILVEMTDANLKKIIKILKRKKYYARIPVDPLGLIDEKTRKDWVKNKHMKALNFYKKNSLEGIDIVFNTPVSYMEARKTAKRIKIDDLIIPVISIDNLIKMKKASSRNIDKIDIQELKKIKSFI